MVFVTLLPITAMCARTPTLTSKQSDHSRLQNNLPPAGQRCYFYFVRDAPVSNVVKYVLVHYYIHTCAINSFSESKKYTSSSAKLHCISLF